MWRIFQRPIDLEPQRIDSVVMACCVLQNFLLDRNAVTFTLDADAYVQSGTWRTEIRGDMAPQPLERRVHGNNVAQDAKQMRTDLREWFNTVGSVVWQDRMVDVGQGLEQQLQAPSKLLCV